MNWNLNERVWDVSLMKNHMKLNAIWSRRARMLRSLLNPFSHLMHCRYQTMSQSISVYYFHFISSWFFIFFRGKKWRKKNTETSISIFYEKKEEKQAEGNKKCMLKISQNMSSYLCFLTGIFSPRTRIFFSGEQVFLLSLLLRGELVMDEKHNAIFFTHFSML